MTAVAAPNPSTQDAARLAKLLQAVYRQQAREVMLRVGLDGPAPDLTHWVKETARIVGPLMARLWQAGAARGLRRLEALGVRPGQPRRGDASPLGTAGAVLGRPPLILEPEGRRTVSTASAFGRMPDGHGPSGAGVGKCWWKSSTAWQRFKARHPLPWAVAKAAKKSKAPADLAYDFDYFNPRVLDAADAATFQFCRETNETARTELSEALDKLHRAMRAGLKREEAAPLLAKRVLRIFADPARAMRIAVTESSRAIHGGALLASKEAGVKFKTWLASGDACDRCLELDGKTVRIDRPFVVLPGGGPYAVVMHPPLHPWCFCDVTESL